MKEDIIGQNPPAEKLRIKLHVQNRTKVIFPNDSGINPFIKNPIPNIISVQANNTTREYLSANLPNRIPETAIIYVEVPNNNPISLEWNDSPGHIIFEIIRMFMYIIDTVNA